MKIRKQYKNLKAGAKKVFVGLLIVSMISTATGIGSVFTYATEENLDLKTQEEKLENMEDVDSQSSDEINDENTDDESGLVNEETGTVDEGNNLDENVQKDDLPADPVNEDEPTSEDITQQDPASEDPTSEDPAQGNPVSEDPTSEDPNSEDPDQNEPASDDPTQQNPTQDDTTTEDPSEQSETTDIDETEVKDPETPVEGNTEIPDADETEEDTDLSEDEEDECDHVVDTWTTDDEGNLVGVCTICGKEVTKEAEPEEEEEEEEKVTKAKTICKHKVDEDSWTDNGDGYHVGICTKCGEKVKEEHNFSKWIWNGENQHTRVCSDCGCEVTEDCEYAAGDESGVCIICNNYAGKFKLFNAPTISSNSNAEFNELPELPTALVEKLIDLSKSGANTSLIYNGKDRKADLCKVETKTGDNTHSDGKTYTAQSNSVKYYIFDKNNNSVTEAINAGDYSVGVSLDVKVADSNSADTVTYRLPTSFAAKINPKDISKSETDPTISGSLQCILVKPGTSTALTTKSFDAGDYSEDNAVALQYSAGSGNTVELVEGTDYTREMTASDGSSAPEAGASTNKMVFKAIGDNYTGQIEDTFSLTLSTSAAISFNGDNQKTFYIGKVELTSSDSSYLVSLEENGNYQSSVEYTDTETKDFYLYVKKGSAGKPFKVQIKDLIVKKADLKDATISSTPDFSKDNFFTLSYTLDGKTTELKEGEDYLYTIEDESGNDCTNSSLEVGKKYYMVYTGIGAAEGTKKQEFTVPEMVTFNGSKTMSSSGYEFSVLLAGATSNGVALQTRLEDGSYADSTEYDSMGYGDFNVFLKKSGNEREFKQLISGLQVKPAPISKATVTLKGYLDDAQYDDVKYIKSDGKEYTLEKDKDYTISYTYSASDNIPAVDTADQVSIKFTGKGNFTGDKTVAFDKINAFKLLYDGSATFADSYYGSVKIAVPSTPDGLTIGLASNGSFDTSIDYDEECNKKDLTVYIKKNDLVVKQVIKGLTILPPPYMFDEFFASAGGVPVAATGLTYNGKAQSLLKEYKEPKVPALKSGESIEIDYTTAINPTSKEADFQKTDAASYENVKYYLSYKYKEKADSPERMVTVSKKYGTITIAPKDINDVVTVSDRLKKTAAGNYDYASSSVDFTKDAFTFALDGKALVAGTDYDMSVSPQLPDAGVAAPLGEHYALNYTGKGNFTGVCKNTIEVAEVTDITYDGSTTLSEKYFGEVVIGVPSGLQVSLTSDGTFADTVTYTELGNKQTVQLYIKNKSTGRIIAQKLSNITITELQVLYDGKPVMAKYYHDSVRITANGFEISDKKNGDYANFYTVSKGGKVPDFTLYFKDKSSDYTKEVTISGLVIYKDIDLPVKYNGGSYKEWFNTNVTITCEGYKMALKGKDKYENSIKVTDDGVNELEISFKNNNDAADIQTFTLVVGIDRTAPTGKIAVGDYSSKTFQTEDKIAVASNELPEITITAKDADSDIDYILYYDGDRFYSAAGDLIRDVSETSAFWKSYSEKKKPKAAKNKKKYIYAIVYDLAGNRTYLSTGSVINDSVNPKMSSLSMTESEDGLSGTINAEGTDSISGVDKFKFIYKEYKESGNADPKITDIVEKGTEIKVEDRGDDSASGKFTVKKLDDEKDYIFYVIAIDAAGNASEFLKKTLRSHTRIEIGDYTSSKLRSEDSTALSSNKAQQVTIISKNSRSIEYYISENFLATPDDINAEIKENSSMWRTYYSRSKPTTIKDKKNYIYAKVTKDDGSVVYLSTGAVIYDTVVPILITAAVTPAEDGSGSLVAVAGKDTLSGVRNFKYMYSEKVEGVTEKLPSKDKMLDDGTTIEVSKEEEGNALGTVTLTSLDATKKYTFYFAVQDNAKNLSVVKEVEVDGASAVPGGADAAGGAGKEGAGSGGLTPAPSGIAGSGDKQKSDSEKTTPTAPKQEDKSTEKEEDKPINRDPYIKDATGSTKIGLQETGGWDKISREVKLADKGTVIEVDMAGTSNVSEKLFESMGEKDVTVKLNMPNNVQWEIKSESLMYGSVTDNDQESGASTKKSGSAGKVSFTPKDMGVKLGTKSIPQQRLTEVVGTNPHIEFSMTTKENPGFEATISIPADVTNAGMNATLYKYDEEKKEMTAVGTAVVDDKGNVQFPITDFADYTVVITPEKALMAADVVASNGVLEYDADDVSSKGTAINFMDIFRTRGGAPIWLFVIAIISAGLCVVILYMPKFQNNNDDDFGSLV